MATEVKIIIGSNFGDEGKGHMTDYFAHNAKKEGKSVIVVCSNGGAQRGHTVELDDGRRHVFHHFGSGTFAGASTYLPKQFILNPMIFNKEYDELIKQGCIPKCVVHPMCIVSTPFDMIMNQIIEEVRGDKRHGSCGVGIWETIVRQKTYDTSFKKLVLLNDNEKDENGLKKYLLKIRDNYLEKRLISEGAKQLSDPVLESKIYKKWDPIIYSDNLIDNWIDDFYTMADRISSFFEEKIISYSDVIIFENGQGLLLDENNGIHSTPSKTGLNNPLEILSNGFCDYKDIDIEIIYVTRPYLTRHGADPSFIEDLTIAREYHDKTNVYNLHQGTIKYGQFQFGDILKNRIDLDTDDFYSTIRGPINHTEVSSFKINIAVTHCDHLNKNIFKEYPNGIPDPFYNYDYIGYKSYGPARKDIFNTCRKQSD